MLFDTQSCGRHWKNCWANLRMPGVPKSFSLSEVWQYGLAEQLCLSHPIITPDLQHDVSAASIAVLRDSLDALVGSSCDRADLAQEIIRHGRSRSFTTAFFHGLRYGLKLRKS